MLLEGLAKKTPSNTQLDNSPAFQIAREVIASWEEHKDDERMAVLNNAFGFGGHNVTLAFTEYIPKET